MKTSLLKFYLAVIFFFQLSYIYSQEKTPVSFGKVSLNDFTINSSLVDSNSSAVIIADVGDTKFEGNNKGWFTYVFKRQTRIKILDKKGFDLATLKIQLYQNENSREKVENLTAVTYNLEDGQVTETKLNPADIFDEKIDKNYSYKKFTLPAVKAGSIIQYTYIVKSDFEFNIPEWKFQNSVCPTLWSEYNVTIPSLLSYRSFFQGNQKFFINEGSEGLKNYSIKRNRQTGSLTDVEERFAVSTPTIIHRWVMKDIAAFNVESYISSPLNYIDKISFQLFKTYDGENYHDVLSTWKNVADDLMSRKDFGLPLTEDNNWLDKILEIIVKDSDDELQTAKKIYTYVQNNFTCTDYDNKFIKTTLQDVVKRKSGTVGDINLLLTALLKRKYISALPVILSTTDAGRNNSFYPIMGRLNYAICKANINSVDYYLDATQPFLEFGKLPLHCYNGHARLISNDTTAIYFLADSIKETSLVTAMMLNSDKGVGGTYNSAAGFFESLGIKNKIAKSNINNYQDSLQDEYREDLVIGSIKVDSFQTAEGTVSVKFDFKLKSFQNEDIIYFNPLLQEGLKKNPFFAAERIYPVEMPYRTEKIYTMRMEIPAGYKIDELPKSAFVKLNEDEGFYEYLVNVDNNVVQIRRRLFLYKANFTSEDYQTLRDFYTYIVKKDSEQIVFKKIR
jgi:Domain of Unknown Function with PDB structure (DUF3857)